jgi:hypothetical protein
MNARRLGVLILAALACVLLPVAASAQSAFSGSVKDTSGAVLPGVTVEAASPALIEKVRSVTTDAQGRYTIVDLRPGIYTLTFTLTGFATLVRSGLELQSNVTLPLSVDLKVGAVEETVTVSGASPLVDVQAASRSQVLTRDIIDALPVTRNLQSVGAIVPGVKMNRPDVGGSQMMEQIAQSTHGSASKDITMQVDGMSINSTMNDNVIMPYHDDAVNQEVSVQTSAVNAEVSAGGLRINMIPKDGGNRVAGTLYLGGTPESWQSANIDDELRAKGVRAPNGVAHVQDFNGSIAGPIIKDRLWWFTSARHISVDEKVTNAFYPDGSPAIVDQYVRDILNRMTAQVTPKNKVSLYFERIWKFKGHELNPGYDVVTASNIRDPKHSLYYVAQSKYTSTITSKLLFEAGTSINIERLSQRYQPGIEKVRYSPEWYAQAARQDTVLNTLRSAALSQSNNLPNKYLVSTALSYVTGSHNFKTGMQWQFGKIGYQYDANADLVQIYRNGAPNSVNVYNTPTEAFTFLQADRGFFAQDTWTRNRLTLSGGVRFEHFDSELQRVDLPPSRFLPARSFGPVKHYPLWNDVAPRFSAVFDLFGDARTALKFTANKYMASWAGGWAARYNPFTFASDTRSWSDLNRDDIAQDNEIGPSNNLKFGVEQSRFPDSNLRREYNIEYGASVQRELLPRVSVLVGYYRRNFRNLEKSINTLLTVNDYIPFTATNPGDGQPITVYNLNPAKRGQVNLVDSNSDVNKRFYDGYELSFNARLPRGGNLFGGWSSDRIRNITCDTNDPNRLRYCDQTELDIPFRQDFKLAGHYPLPWGFAASATLMSFAGNANQTEVWPFILQTQSLTVNWPVPSTLFPGGQTVAGLTIPVIPPGTKFLNRWQQLDVDGRRTFKIGKYQWTGILNVYNTLNSNVVLTENQTFGPALGQPLTILQGRIFRAALQMKF